MAYNTWSEAYKKKVRLRIVKRVRGGDKLGCLLWHGRKDKNGYGRISVQFGPKCRDAALHRVAYFLYHGALDKELQVCHLCHRKNCIEKEHLSLEPNSVTNQRGNCVRNCRCTGHEGASEQKYKDCVLHPVPSPKKVNKHLLPGPHVCNVCSRVFATFQGLISHRRIHKGQVQSSQEEEETKSSQNDQKIKMEFQPPPSPSAS